MGDWRYDNGCQLEPQWPMTDATHPRLAYLSPSLPFSTPPSVVRRFSESFCGERAAFVKLLSYIEKRTGMYFQFCAKTSSSPSSSSFYSVNMKMALVRQHTDQYTYQSHSWMQQKFSCNNTNLSVQNLASATIRERKSERDILQTERDLINHQLIIGNCTLSLCRFYMFLFCVLFVLCVFFLICLCFLSFLLHCAWWRWRWRRRWQLGYLQESCIIVIIIYFLFFCFFLFLLLLLLLLLCEPDLARKRARFHKRERKWRWSYSHV